ncbi:MULTISPECIES: ferritin-like domain-containing protein [unclassified Pseudomonas]|uniref:ferritin-like domain-containing protein n=1 Tax=unclassified Pseudomonas TaxID=196821 RepID=UPI00244BCD70|nr:PA2169 family four-helix-bundle protein [Pseudomonas sp. GD03944]MDH1265742.1 PA2169 family four-helix-bundle protein [Pseudomonas sp. GD03944]HWV07952.1 PA2169 family four-helix-bundle protein [Pseudomonas sp.]
MTSKTAQLNELIEITRDGQRFYEHAHDAVKDVRLQALFRDMSQVKTQVIQALAVKVAANQETPSSGGTVIGKLRQVYADTRASLSSDEEATYVAQLEEAEDRILHAFEDALESAEPDVRALLAVEMPKVRACHDRMRSLKLSMQ